MKHCAEAHQLLNSAKAINGRPVTEFSLEHIRQMLKQESEEYVLQLKRGSQTLEVKLKTRRLI